MRVSAVEKLGFTPNSICGRLSADEKVPRRKMRPGAGRRLPGHPPQKGRKQEEPDPLDWCCHV